MASLSLFGIYIEVWRERFLLLEFTRLIVIAMLASPHMKSLIGVHSKAKEKVPDATRLD